MIAKLKTECGPTFTNKFEGMFKDIDLSKELMANYAQYIEGLHKTNPAVFRGDNADMMVQVARCNICRECDR